MAESFLSEETVHSDIPHSLPGLPQTKEGRLDRPVVIEQTGSGIDAIIAAIKAEAAETHRERLPQEGESFDAWAGRIDAVAKEHEEERRRAREAQLAEDVKTHRTYQTGESASITKRKGGWFSGIQQRLMPMLRRERDEEMASPDQQAIPSQETAEDDHQQGVVHVAEVAHNADTLELVEKANQDDGADEVEVNFNISLEPYPVPRIGRKTAVIRHGLPVPFREYPTATSFIRHIDPEKKIVFDLKMLPHHPLTGWKERALMRHIFALLPVLQEERNNNFAITGGSPELLDAIAEAYPDVELRYTVWSESGYSNVLERGDRVKAVSVRASVFKRLGKDAFQGKNVYVFGADPDEEEELKRIGVAGIISDAYKEYQLQKL